MSHVLVPQRASKIQDSHKRGCCRVPANALASTLFGRQPTPAPGAEACGTRSKVCLLLHGGLPSPRAQQRPCNSSPRLRSVGCPPAPAGRVTLRFPSRPSGHGLGRGSLFSAYELPLRDAPRFPLFPCPSGSSSTSLHAPILGSWVPCSPPSRHQGPSRLPFAEWPAGELRCL